MFQNMRKPYKSIQVFKSPFLERFTHVHPLTPAVVWLPIVVGLLWVALMVDHLNASKVLVVGGLGFFLWTLFEYLIHRFLFHFEFESQFGQRIHFLIHGIHHDDPIDPTRLVMPPPLSILLGVGVYSLFQFFLGPQWVRPFFAFFVLGYLAYDYTHFAVHHFNPRTRLGKVLKQNHMQHHFVDPRAFIGVSSPIWDYVFGTTLQSSKNKERLAAK